MLSLSSPAFPLLERSRIAIALSLCAALSAWACGRSGLDQDFVETSGSAGSAGATGTSAGSTGTAGTVSGTTGTGTGSAGTVTGSAGSVTGAAGSVTGSTGMTGASGSPGCGPNNCIGGCCRGDTCLPGGDVVNCGSDGQACVTCPSNSACSSTATVRACLPRSPCQISCQGCCEANGTCQAGFLDNACGQNGSVCVNCSGLAPSSTCATNSMPRVCASQQTQCPAPYPRCPPGITASMPRTQAVCSASDLMNAAAACSSSAHTPGCQAFFQFEQQQNPACASCLSPFDFDFSELNGIIACVSPFVGAACSHDLGCLNDCENQACAKCGDAASTAQCRNEVAGNECAVFANNAICIQTALLGPGAFCNPLAAQGQFGTWLANVGANYCLR